MAVGMTVVGLGPGSADLLTLEAWQVLAHAPEVYLRTKRHPTVPDLPLGPRYQSFDDLYENGGTFAEVYEQIAQQILTLARRPQGVVYAVPGHPLVAETTVHRLLALAQQEQLPVRIVAGLSFIEPVLGALGIDPFDGLQLCDAADLATRYHPNLDPDVPVLIAQVYNRRLASELKLTLMNLYHDDQPVVLVRAVGTATPEVRTVPLFELDRQADLDHLTSIYIPALAHPGSLASYQNIVARLRAPGGCPWDREQTHQSLRKHLLEETYEVLDALDADDMPALREELGDLLLQVLLHAQIATEDGDFKLIDTVQYVIEKLVRRHPHVFGEAVVADADGVLRNWEQIKREERGDQPAFTVGGDLARSTGFGAGNEMQARAARVGFDWPTIQPVLDKIAEEVGEMQCESGPERQAEELGDVLFSLVNLARWLKLDPESALRATNQRFARRFAAIEREAVQRGIPVEQMTLAEMDAVWGPRQMRRGGSRPRILPAPGGV